MWSPTHVQVTVQRAKGLLTKGKNGTNNCFVTIGLGKEKYQTSVKEKSEANVNWNEECELKIPDQGNRAELVLTCLHRNNLGIDEFLGQATLPLNEMDVYDRPRSKWHRLESKPGKEKKNKERGELEVRISFVVKSGSLTDLSKKDKHKSSIGQLASSVGGSLLSIGTIEKRKGIKKFAKSLGSKMHLHSKKKNKDGGDDASSFSGSFASIGTPNGSNGGSRRYGQRAGEADPGVISEDEDEFVFDNLSHKSSGSSLNLRAGVHHTHPHQTQTQPQSQQPQQQSQQQQQQSQQQLQQQPQQSHNFVPQNPSPLLGLNGKAGGKQQHQQVDEDLAVDPELEEIANDFSVRARTLPAPPSKPPRTPQLSNETTANAADEPKMDEWESKLYGGAAGQHLQVGSSDSLKRRSWELARVPLPTSNEDKEEEEEVVEVEEKKVVEEKKSQPQAASSDDSSSSSSDEDDEPVVEPPPKPEVLSSTPKEAVVASALRRPRINLLSPESEAKDFDQYNASFAKFEQRNSSKIFELDSDGDDKDDKWGGLSGATTQAFIAKESQAAGGHPAPQPRPRVQTQKDKEADEKAAEDLKKQLEEEKQQREEEEEAAKAEELRRQSEALEKAETERRRRSEEDARLEAELRMNEQRLRDEELSFELELRQRREEEQRRRDAKRQEEDQRILNFVKRSSSLEDESPDNLSTPEQSPKELLAERREQRLGKYKFKRAADKGDVSEHSPVPKSTERIIIGHEKSMSHAERRSEITAALAKKYEGKSREELMLIANGMENEALLQRQRVKELEDYLDNLLLRVMETHPKILQNPYSRTTSAKSG